MLKKRHPLAGARPGTLVIPDDALPTRVSITQYAPDFVREERGIEDVLAIKDQLDDARVTWIDVQGMRDEATLRAIANVFSIHPLAMEDVVNVPQHPKSESYGGQQLIICRAVGMSGPVSIRDQQVSLIVGPNYVIAFQEYYGDILEPVRQRIHLSDSRLRQSGPDYLVYAILDVIVDAYYPVLETLSENLERLEDLVVERPEPHLLKQLNATRIRLANLRRAVWPKRELVRTLIHDDNPLVGEQARLFLRDTHDHVVQISDAVDMCREMVSSLMSTYISAVGHRTNEVMKVLTIMSSIFVPLTFMAGIYGMNFEHMPELGTTWGYPAVWLAMLSCVGGMLYFFRRRGWIGDSGVSSFVELTDDEKQPHPSGAAEPQVTPPHVSTVSLFGGTERLANGREPLSPSVAARRAS